MLVRIAFVAALTVGVSPLLYGPVLAQVPRIQGQGTAASGMGNAFSAQADDPSALHYNPAGMTQLRGVEFMTGALLSGGTTTFTSPTGVTATGDRDGSLAWPPPTHLYLTANLKDLGIRAFGDLTAGIGVTVPFGSVTRWPNARRCRVRFGGGADVVAASAWRYLGHSSGRDRRCGGAVLVA